MFFNCNINIGYNLYYPFLYAITIFLRFVTLLMFYALAITIATLSNFIAFCIKLRQPLQTSN